MMTEPKKKRIFLEMWYPETDTFGMLPFEPEDVDFMLDKGMITETQLIDAFRDQGAFEFALYEIIQSNCEFKYSKVAKLYLSVTQEDIVIIA